MPKVIAQSRTGVGHSSARLASFADVEETSQKCPRGDHDASRSDSQTQIGFCSNDLAILDKNPRHGSLFKVKIFGRLQNGLHTKLISLLVALRPRRSDRWPLRPVKHSKLNPCGIRV